jgi:hypothetical protein
LTNNSQCSLDFTTYQEASFLSESEFDIEEVHPQVVHQPQNFYFNPPTSSDDTDDSEDQTNRPLVGIPQHLIRSDESLSDSLPALIH